MDPEIQDAPKDELPEDHNEEEGNFDFNQAEDDPIGDGQDGQDVTSNLEDSEYDFGITEDGKLEDDNIFSKQQDS